MNVESNMLNQCGFLELTEIKRTFVDEGDIG